MNNKTFYVINEDGIRVDAKALSKFKLTNDRNYLTYTFNEINADGMIKIYVTGISLENGLYSYREIATDQEWNDIKTILKTLAKSEEDPFPETIMSDLKIVGEEISIRKPKKLLVSKKFADVLESKFIEQSNDSNSVQLEIPTETPVTPVTPETAAPKPVPSEPVHFEPVKTEEPDLEKTIKIPTFEELQARNKTIEVAMETAKEEKASTPTYRTPSYDSRVKKLDYEEQFKKDVEPVLLDVYAKQQKHIEELEEELSKTKFDLFEKQKEALSLSNEKEQIEKKTEALEQQLDGVQRKMNGILSVLQDK